MDYLGKDEHDSAVARGCGISIVSGNDGIEIRIKGRKRKFVLGISDPVRVEEIIKKQWATPMLTH